MVGVFIMAGRIEARDGGCIGRKSLFMSDEICIFVRRVVGQMLTRQFMDPYTRGNPMACRAKVNQGSARP